MTRRVAVGGGVVVALMAIVWFSPVLVGEQFTTVPTHQTAVYPWRGALPYNGDRYAQSDQADLNAGWEALQARAMAHGTVPLWNPESFAGQPLMANGSSGVLYPPRLLFSAVLSPSSVHTALSLFHVIAAGVFMYLLLLDLGVAVPAAVLGAVAWMFGTYTLDWIQLEVTAPVFAWLPAGMLVVRHAVDGTRRWMAAGALVIGLLLVGTHLPFAGVTIAAFMGYGAAIALSSGPHRFRRLCTLLAVGALGAGLAAVTLLPTASLLIASDRASFNYTTLVHAFLLAPSALRYLFYAPPHGVGSSAEVHMHQAAFVGTVVVLCAVVGVFLRRAGAGLGRGLVLVTVLIAIGGPVTWLTYHFVPGMQAFRPYSRLLFLTDFGVAVLGAVGFDWLLRRIGHRHPGVVVVAGVTVLFTAIQLGVYGRHENPPFARPSSIYPATPMLTALRGLDAAGVHRILPLRLDSAHAPMLYAGEAMAFGIDSAGGYDSVVPVRTVDLWEVVNGRSAATTVGMKGPQDFVPTWELATTRFDLLPRLGIDRIVSAPEVLVDSARIYRLEAMGWRRAYQGSDGIIWVWTGPPVGPHVVGTVVPVRGDLAAITAFTQTSFDATSEVVLEEGAGRPRSGPSSSSVSEREGVNSVTLTVHSNGGYLVVPNSWDAGWHATVAGHSARVLRANFDQQAIAVPSGTVRVTLRYVPPGLPAGRALSLIAIFLLVLPPPSRVTEAVPAGAAHGRHFAGAAR